MGCVFLGVEKSVFEIFKTKVIFWGYKRLFSGYHKLLLFFRRSKRSHQFFKILLDILEGRER